jgi:hypothetical protein
VVQDWLGLQQLANSGRLQQIPCIGDHLQFTDQYFIDTVIYPYLNQTFTSSVELPNASTSAQQVAITIQ